MARPTSQDPTPAEFEVLEVLWSDKHPKTVREAKNTLDTKRPRAYTTVMTLMNGMVAKGLLKVDADRRPFAYSAAVSPRTTRAHLLNDLWARVFNRSASALVEGLLKEVKPSQEELRRITQTIKDYLNDTGGVKCKSSNSSRDPSATELP